MKQFLEGKKTYLVGGGLVALGGAVLFGAVELTPEQLGGLVTTLLGFAQAFMRAGVSKIEKKVGRVKGVNRAQ